MRISCAVAGLCLLLAGACTGDKSGVGAGPTPQPHTSVKVGDTRYFDDPAFVGRPVSLSGTVIEVITPTSFVVDARDHGDDSLLVLSRPRTDVVEGASVLVDGRVEVFRHASYADGYDLAAAERYREFAGEQFVAAAQPGESSLTPGG